MLSVSVSTIMNYQFRPDIILSMEDDSGDSSEIYSDIKDLQEIDAQMWDPYPTITNNIKNSNHVDESVKELFEWLADRLDFCDSYFS